MKIVWIYTGDDGRSHFADLEAPMQPVNFGIAAPAIDAGRLLLREAPPGENGWHRAPMRQLVVVITGIMEIEVGDGGKRTFRPGDIMLADDTTGQGHITRDIGGPRQNVQIGIPDDLDVASWRV